MSDDDLDFIVRLAGCEASRHLWMAGFRDEAKALARANNGDVVQLSDEALRVAGLSMIESLQKTPEGVVVHREISFSLSGIFG